MLEAAANADLVSTISLRRNTPNLLLSTSGPADYPISLRQSCRDANLVVSLRLTRSGHGRYSITSSAIASSIGGTSKPNALAVARLSTSSNFVGCITGRSAGFSPLRVRPKTSSRITEFSQHEADGCEFQERKGAAVEIFLVLGEATAAVEPGDRAFDVQRLSSCTNHSACADRLTISVSTQGSILASALPKSGRGPAGACARSGGS